MNTIRKYRQSLKTIDTKFFHSGDNNMLTLKKSIHALAIATALASVSVVAQAEEGRVVNNGYAVSDQTGQVMRDSYGQCWHTDTWTPAKATVVGCDGYTGGRKVSAPVAPVKDVQRFTLKTDTLFAYDQYALRGEGKQSVDKLFEDLKNNNPKDGQVVVVGYTDRIGSDQYNDALSVKRANTVRSYLIAKGVPADKIHAEGRGKSNPITGDKCQGTHKTKELIACLQPDRRVEIEVQGKRLVVR